METTTDVRIEGPAVSEESRAAAARYFDAWNTRTGGAVVAALTDDGTYADPATPGPLSGQALAEYVDGLVTIFPDLSFDLVSETWLTEDTVFAEWLMRGTNTGPLPGGAPPLGRTVVLPGNDVLVVRDGKVQSVRGMFDRITMLEQLGLQVTPYPAEPIGPFSFGGGAMIHAGSTEVPQAFGLTVLRIRGEEEHAAVQQRSRVIFAELLGVPGFMAAMGVTFGDRMYTFSAWDSADGPRSIAKAPTHNESVRAMHKENLGRGGLVATYVLTGSRYKTRCANDHLVELEDGVESCPTCGEPVERLEGPVW